MPSAEFQHAIAEPWLSLPPVRVGSIPSGLGTPDRYVTVDAGAVLMRVDVYGELESGACAQQALLWKDLLVIGFGNRVFVVPFDQSEVKTIDLGSYFGSFRVEGDVLLVASADHVLRLSPNGEVIWMSEELGIDGVVIDHIQDSVVYGRGEWDPPGGWKPFAVNLDSGELVNPAV